MKWNLPIGALLLAFAFTAAGCGDPYTEPLPPRDRLNYPIGLTVHPNGRYLYVVNSNFDTRYREEVGGTLSVVDLQTLELRERSTPFIPSFGGFVRLNRNASKAFVSARHSNAVIEFDVAADGSAVFCRDGETQTSDPQACAWTRVPKSEGAAEIPSDPFAMDVMTLDWQTPSGSTFDIDLVNLAHLRGESVTSIALARSGDETGATMKSASLIPGGSALARRPGTRDIYVGGRVSREIVIFYPYLEPETGAVQAVIRRGSIVLGNVGQTVDTRGLAFSEDGETLYVVTRAPDALHVVDLGPSNPETAGGTLGKVTTSIPIPSNPSDVFVHEGVDGTTRLYIPSFDEELIVVVDPEAKVVEDEIEVGAEPYHFVVDRAPSRCIPGAPCRAYVSLFNDLPTAAGTCAENRTEQCGSVGIIDLNPDSPRFHQLIGKIH
jgi:DNA-binding beta-propeller fold protein YncE